MTKAAILALMFALVPPARQIHNDEAEDAARVRYAVIAEAIREVSHGDAELARYLLTVARHESSFTRGVHTGVIRGDGGRSWSLYQFNLGGPTAAVPRTPWVAMEVVGVDYLATYRPTSAAAGWLAPYIESCRGNVACVFQRYGSVENAEDPRILARVSTYRKLQRLTAKPTAVAKAEARP
jgi:hypothetical protein